MMALQHSSVRKSLHWHANATVGIFSMSYAINANVGIFSLSYAVMPSSLVSVLFIDPYLIFIVFNTLVCLVFQL